MGNPLNFHFFYKISRETLEKQTKKCYNQKKTLGENNVTILRHPIQRERIINFRQRL